MIDFIKLNLNDKLLPILLPITHCERFDANEIIFFLIKISNFEDYLNLKKNSRKRNALSKFFTVVIHNFFHQDSTCTKRSSFSVFKSKFVFLSIKSIQFTMFGAGEHWPMQRAIFL